MEFSKLDIDHLFNIFNKALTELTPDQLASLLAGDLEITFKERDVKTEKDKVLREIVEGISSSKTRKNAIDYLLESKSLKKDLVELGNYLQIYLRRNDSKEQIVNKIIDATFGVTSRSKAIKGLDLKKK